MLRRPAILVAGLMLAGALAPPSSALAQRVPYEVLPQSVFEVRTDTEGVLGFFAHEHLIVADSVRATLEYDPAAPERSRIEVVVPVVALRVATEADRDDRDEIAQAMRDGVLLSDQYPTIRFSSVHGESTPSGPILYGQLTLRDVVRGVLVPLELEQRGDTLVVEGAFTVRQSHFDIEPYSIKLGSIRVADEVEFRVHVVAVPRPAGE